MLPFMMLLLATNSLYDILRSRSVEAFYSVVGTAFQSSSQPDFIRRLLDLEGMPDVLRQGITSPPGKSEEHLIAYLKSHSCRSLCVRLQIAILSDRFEEFEQRLRTEFLLTHNIGYPGSREEANELAGDLWPILVVAFRWIARAVRTVINGCLSLAT